MKDLFSGRVMKCETCGFIFTSRENIESMFTTLEIDGKLLDYCPFCWGVPIKNIPVEVKTAHEVFKKGKGGKKHGSK